MNFGRISITSTCLKVFPFRLHCRRPPLSSQGRRPRIELSVTRASLDVKEMKEFHLYALISAQSMYVQSLYFMEPLQLRNLF